jgi:hypothetical protein
MRTTLDLPEDLLKEAMQLSNARTKTGTVILSLQELINKRKIERLRELKGKLDLDIDLDALRRDRTAS